MDPKDDTKTAEAKAEEAAPAKLPEWLEEDYSGPLTCDQAAARIEHLKLHGRQNVGDLKAYETKPATVANAKGGK